MRSEWTMFYECTMRPQCTICSECTICNTRPPPVQHLCLERTTRSGGCTMRSACTARS